jgi:glyoxylase-like metal-dependent hydrolase (beta-lactamase superfamily II)
MSKLTIVNVGYRSTNYSVSLLLDDDPVFTGDLTRLEFVGGEDAAVVTASWQLLWERGARRVYPGHGPIWQLDRGN